MYIVSSENVWRFIGMYRDMYEEVFGDIYEYVEKTNLSEKS